MEKSTYFEEAMRYMENAKESLMKTSFEDGFYKDEKYVKQAAGIAYAGLEKAARWYLRLNGYKQPLPNNYEIIKGLTKFNGKAKNLFNEGYTILHQDAYYNDNTGVEHIKLGMKYANEFIVLLQPYKKLLESENAPDIKKRRLTRKKR
jgi:hypothetical protein